VKQNIGCKRCHRGKKYKDRMTLLLCCNANGKEKLKPSDVEKIPKAMMHKKYYALSL